MAPVGHMADTNFRFTGHVLLMTIKGEKTMNRLSLIRYTSAVALGFSTLWSAAVCAAEDAGAFDKIQQIRAGDLNIGYVDIGPRDGQPVILLHGWPYDIQSWRPWRRL